MKPKQKEFVQEKIATEEWIDAVIEDIKYEEAHEFGGQFAKTGEAVRFVFRLKGYQHPKMSRWLTFSYSEKSNLFNKFVKPLVRNAKPFFDYDIMALKGQKCRLMFSEDQGDNGQIYYNIEMVKPQKDAPVADALPEIQIESTEENVPF